MTVIAAILLTLFLPALARAADGALDLTFGRSGQVTTNVGSREDRVHALAIQRDGKIVVAGVAPIIDDNDNFDARGFALARYDTDGSLDLSFGDAGVVFTSFDGVSAGADAIAIQEDGRIVVAGYADRDFALARYEEDGSLDTSFGSGGRVRTDIQGGDARDRARALALQRDGRIVTAGFTCLLSDCDFALARHNPDGSRDPSFGVGGTAVTHFGEIDQAQAIAIQDDGGIVSAGFTHISGETRQFALARHHADGSLDTFFGNAGLVTLQFGDGEDEATAVRIQPDGRIVAAGTMRLNGTDVDFALARFNVDGSPDLAFGTAGRTSTDFVEQSFDSLQALAVRPDGRIVAAGYTHIGDRSVDVALARYDAFGALDPTFGSAGKVVADFFGGSDIALAMAVQSDGRIVVGGSAFIAGTGNDFALSRFLATDDVVAPAEPQTLDFYLHGSDVAGTAGGFTMSPTPGAGQPIALDLAQAPRWFSASTLTGTFDADSVFTVTMPRALALNLGVTISLAATAADGGEAQALGETTIAPSLGMGPLTATIPVATPVTLTNRRLRLTISSTLSLGLALQPGSGTFLSATGFRAGAADLSSASARTASSPAPAASIRDAIREASTR